MCALSLIGRELKVVTGEWFMEERSRRFDQGTVLSSDVVKKTIMNSPAGEEHIQEPQPHF